MSNDRKRDVGDNDSQGTSSTSNMKKELSAARSRIEELEDKNEILRCDLTRANSQLEEKDVEVARLQDRNRQLAETLNLAHRNVEDYRFQMEKIREEYRAYQTEMASLRAELITADDSSRQVLHMMRRHRKRTVPCDPPAIPSKIVAINEFTQL